MTEQELVRIIATSEMQQLEFKEGFGVECLESACAFATARGGYILIGVCNDGSLSKKPLRIEALRDYENRISTATEPSVSVEAEKVSYRGGEVVVLKVSECPLKPVAYKGRCLVRRGSVNHQMTPAEIAECHLKTIGSSLDHVPVPGATRADLDDEAIRFYMAKAVEKGRRSFDVKSDDPWVALKKINVVESETSIPRGVLVMFGREPQRFLPQALVRCAFIRGRAHILDRAIIGGPLVYQVDATLAFLRRNMRLGYEVSGRKSDHDEYWDYPLDALRESIANAICHRDYSLDNDIQIKLFEDHLRIWSPGRLPFDMTMEMLFDPDHSSRPRNKLIAQFFFDMGVIERYGSGISRIGEACKINGNPFPKLTEEPDGFVATYTPRSAPGALNGTTNGNINGTIKEDNSPESAQNDEDQASEAADGKINGKINGTINYETRYLAEGELTPNEQKIIDLVAENPGCKRAFVIERMTCSVRTADRALATLIAINRLSYRGSKKTGGYYALQAKSKSQVQVSSPSRRERIP